jgi:hypothetical protein
MAIFPLGKLNVLEFLLMQWFFKIIATINHNPLLDKYSFPLKKFK